MKEVNLSALRDIILGEWSIACKFKSSSYIREPFARTTVARPSASVPPSSSGIPTCPAGNANCTDLARCRQLFLHDRRAEVLFWEVLVGGLVRVESPCEFFRNQPEIWDFLCQLSYFMPPFLCTLMILYKICLVDLFSNYCKITVQKVNDLSRSVYTLFELNICLN